MARSQTLSGLRLTSTRSTPARGPTTTPQRFAIALEVARNLLDERDDVAFVFTDNEEAAMVGSRHLARHAPRPKLVINLESLGYYSSEPNSQRVIPEMRLLDRALSRQLDNRERRGDFVLVLHRPSSFDAAHTIYEDLVTSGMPTYRLEDRRWNGPGQAFTARLNPIGMTFDRSDHSPFWRAQIPALALTDTAGARNPNYHRPTDTPDTLDYARMSRITEALIYSIPRIWRGHHSSTHRIL